MRYPSAMQHARRLARLCLLVCLALTGCLSFPSAPATQEPSPASPFSTIALPTSPAGPLPEVTFSDLVVQRGDEQDEWIVLGMAHNNSTSALESVAVLVALLDVSGAATGETTVLLPLSVLQPGAFSPFMVRSEQAEGPAAARASLGSFQFSSETAPRLSIGTVYTTQSPGGILVRGTVHNDGVQPMRVRDVVVAWRDASRALRGLAIATVPGATLPADGSLPWIADAPGTSPATRFEVFVAASPVDSAGESLLVVTDGPTWRLTSQGKGFATGALRNAGNAPILPQVAIAVSAAGRPISLEILQSSIPLQPGETLTFAADQFPGLQATLQSLDADTTEITLEAYVQGRSSLPDAGAAFVLPVSISRFEAIGSSLFLRGTVSNPDSVPLRNATVFVSLRSTTGEPQSARWLELASPPDEAGTVFSVDLPLAAGVDPAMCEYDVRAFGLPLPDSSW